MVNNKSVSCQEYFSNSKIPQQKLEMVSLVSMLSSKDREYTFSLDEEFELLTCFLKLLLKITKRNIDIIVFV